MFSQKLEKLFSAFIEAPVQAVSFREASCCTALTLPFKDKFRNFSLWISTIGNTKSPTNPFPTNKSNDRKL
jgi:hypothetical protein